jgi:hypothetical protein
MPIQGSSKMSNLNELMSHIYPSILSDGLLTVGGPDMGANGSVIDLRSSLQLTVIIQQAQEKTQFADPQSR